MHAIQALMDERLDGILCELSLEKDYLFHVTDKKPAAKIYRAMVSAEKHRDEITSHILASRIEYQKRLTDMGHFLKDYIERGLS